MGVIDLGTVADGPPPLQPSRPRRNPPLRWAAVALVGVLCLSLAGSGRPQSHGPRPLWSIPAATVGQSFLLTDGLVIRQELTTAPVVVAYDLISGKQRWSWSADGLSGVSMLPPPGVGQVLVDLASGPSMRRSTVALDTATGRPRWRQPGAFLGSSDGLALLVESDDAGPGAIRAVHVPAGTTAWRRSMPSASTFPLPTGDTSDRLVIVDDQLHAAVWRLRDGTEVARGRLAAPTGTRDEQNSEYFADRSHVYLVASDGHTTTVVAHSLDDLRPMWRYAAPGPATWVGCGGTVVCLRDERTLTGLDRRTGAVRWSAPGRHDARPMGDGLLASDAAGFSHAVLDATTGRVVTDLGPGVPVWDPAGSVLLVRPTRIPAGRSAVRRFDPATRTARLLGTIGETGDSSCQTDRDVLVCDTKDYQVVATALG